MKIIGISPLDKDSTACLVVDGRVVCAIAEERLSRIKMHSGFPYKAIAEIFRLHDIGPDDVDSVVYAFADWQEETRLIDEALAEHLRQEKANPCTDIASEMSTLPIQPNRQYAIPGLEESALYVQKNPLHKFAYRVLSTRAWVSAYFTRRQLGRWRNTASNEHKKWSVELAEGLKHFGLEKKLERVDHHLTHAANAYLTSGFDEALIVTLDGYGSGLGGSVSLGKDGKIERLHSLPYPTSLGEFYERVTSSLGFQPGRHEGKIVGLAAYESPDVLFDTVRTFFEGEGKTLRYRQPHNFALSRHLAAQFAKPTVAAAYQKVLEVVAQEYIRPFIKSTGVANVVLSGGVVANVKANQRIFEIDGVEQIFIHPNMGDGGCSVGAALVVADASSPLPRERIEDVYWGQEFNDEDIEKVLKQSGIDYHRSDDVDLETASLLAQGHIVARFAGRMEYGPRSLGNRSILYHAKDPEVNLWLNTQLNRTEFMPFAPATLYEERNTCYLNITGAEHAASFMTITFDCTELMKKQSPAAVHVDGTARPQLVSAKSNPGFHKVLTEYYRLTGSPSVINTSFNMHEEPIVCSPADAVRAFRLGKLPYLAIGSYIAHQPDGILHAESTQVSLEQITSSCTCPEK